MLKHKYIFTIALITLSAFLFQGCKTSSKPVKILSADQVENQVEYESFSPALSDTQLENYKEYVETENEQLLNGLSPIDIFKYYYHAFEEGENNILYGLCIKGEKFGTPSKKEFLENKESNVISKIELLKNQEDNIRSFAQIKYDKKTSYIQVNFKEDNELTKADEWNFKFIKNSQDIWKIEYPSLVK